MEVNFYNQLQKNKNQKKTQLQKRKQYQKVKKNYKEKKNYKNNKKNKKQMTVDKILIEIGRKQKQRQQQEDKKTEDTHKYRSLPPDDLIIKQ
ncbi:unnamed protein product [Paramecium primaurelia]|uniref:Uncharacterized protein n=1 Tax=Paramecium primaurelia TaxID=5886 RepID=A0A8S1K2X5_PARPR|nr:unnamed protein product [Paramecium primaurelia]